jgi:hypothetical protein
MLKRKSVVQFFTGVDARTLLAGSVFVHLTILLSHGFLETTFHGFRWELVYTPKVLVVGGGRKEWFRSSGTSQVFNGYKIGNVQNAANLAS